MPELINIKPTCDLPILYGRAEPDDEYSRPEPVDPKQIERHRYEDEDDEYDEEEDEDDERKYRPERLTFLFSPLFAVPLDEHAQVSQRLRLPHVSRCENDFQSVPAEGIITSSSQFALAGQRDRAGDRLGHRVRREHAAARGLRPELPPDSGGRCARQQRGRSSSRRVSVKASSPRLEAL